MKIIILGASGQIGSQFHRALHAKYPAATIFGTSRKPPADTDLQWVAFDPFTDDWAKLGQADVLINCIGQIQEEKGMSFSRISEGMTEMMLEHRARMGNPRIVQISALGADPEHKTGFLKAKGKADAALLAQSDTVVLRPSIVCTENTMLVQKISTLVSMSKFTFRKVFCPRGFLGTRIQPIHPNDLSQMLLAIINNPEIGGIVEAGGPESLTFREIIQLMTEKQPYTLKWLEVPREVIDTFVRYFLSIWFPGLINYDQFQLLFTDNVVTRPLPENLPEICTTSVQPFFRNALQPKEIKTPEGFPDPVPEGN